MNIQELGAVEAVKLMQDGDLGVEKYILGIINKNEDWESLNAFSSFSADKLQEQARKLDIARSSGQGCGPLFGLPIAIKDNICTVEYPTTAGTESLKTYRPAGNAPALQNLLDQGALVAGKTVMHELALGITSNNGVYGPVRNPYNMNMIPGGSSGGSAAAVGAGIVPVALGTDTGASVRLPASLCGIVGFRPTIGRYDVSGVIPVALTRDTIGPLARSVEDILFLDNAITNTAGNITQKDLSGFRIGVPREYFYEDLDGEVERLAKLSLDRLKDLGAILVEENIPDVGALNEAVSFTIVEYEVVADLRKYLVGTGISFEEVINGLVSPDVKSMMQALTNAGAEQDYIDAISLSEQSYNEAIHSGRPQLQAAYREYFHKYNLDAVVFPTAQMTARPIGQDETIELNGRQVSTFMSFVHNTEPASVAGIPGISVPAGLTSNGLPVGMEFDGPENSDRGLLKIAYAFQKSVGEFPKPPKPTKGA